MTQAPTPGPLSVLAFHCESARLVPLLRKEAERLGKGVPTDLPGLHKDIWTAAEIIEQAEEAFAFTQKMDALAPTAPVEASGSERERLISVMRDHIELGEIGACSAEIIGHEEAADAILALLSARPLALGGQQGVLAVDPEDMRIIGDWINDGELSSSVPAGRIKALWQDVRKALSTTPARAEAQDEGAAGEPVAWEVWDNPKGPIYLTRMRSELSSWKYSRPLYAHPSPTPAADADRVRDV